MDPRLKYKELIESARRNQTIGELATAVGICVVALGLLWMAYETYRGRLRLTKDKPLTGAPATVVAALLALLAVGVMIGTLFFWPGILRRERP